MFAQFIKKHLLDRSTSFKFWFFTMIIVLFSVLIFFLLKTPTAAATTNDPVVNIPNGRLVGSELTVFHTSVYTYLGVPYALPANKYRFKPPLSDDRVWSEDKVAKAYGPGCPQPDEYIAFQRLAKTGKIKYDEDCLTLNIWTPVYFNKTNPVDDKNLKSVLVFIHGGALLFNSASEEKYFEGKYLAAIGEIVVVTLNYRLGVLGFLYNGKEAKGNLGLLDQRLAMEWVKKNIKQFGGDPNKITISGESAGSWSVGIHLLLQKQGSDQSLFQNAIMMSGSPLAPALEEPEEVALKKYDLVLKRMKCKDIECLQKKPLKELMSLHFDQEIINLYKNTYRLAFQPVYGTNNGLIEKSTFEQLLDKDYKVKNTSLLIGNLVNEGIDSWGLWKMTFKEDIKDPKKTKDEFIKALSLFVNTTINLDKAELKSLAANLDRFYFKEEVLDRLKSDEDSDAYEFSLQSSFYELLSDLVFICPGKFFAESYFNKIQSENVYEYEISYESSSPGSKEFAPWCEQTKYGPCHMVDLQYLFGRPFKQIQQYTQNDRAMSFEVIKTFSNFARSGKTNWKSYFKMKVKQDELIVPTEYEMNPETGNDELIGVRYLACELIGKYLYQTKNRK